ncbi:MAG TPA: aldo/keto reductase [Terriglobales bacterium]|nr:aldo/keto reductase [Terriglobales bacterium]
MAAQKKGLSRRALLAGAGAATAGVAGCKWGSQLFLLSDAPEAEEAQEGWSGSQVRSYRRLGRTGFEMSDISFGCSNLNDPQVARRAIERGINYFDTSPDYSDHQSEKALGAAIQGARRDKLFVVSKFCNADGHLADDTPVKDVIAAVESSLQRLRTDYLDLVHVHACNSIERLMAANIHEAFDRLKEAGKVRFIGVSSHTPDLEKVMRHAVDSGRFDVIMVAYNFKNWPDLTQIFADAHRRGVGVVAMKTLKGAQHSSLADFTPSERESFAQAAFKWVLSNRDVSGLVVTIDRFALIDEYLYASGAPLQEQDVALLEKYDRLISKDYCRPGCGDCLDACPYGLPIDDVLRYSMYFEHYGQQKEAMRLYGKLAPSQRADHCAGCAAPCEARCEFGLPVRAKMEKAHRLLV